MNLYNSIDEIVRNLKKELQQPKKQYGEPPDWIPSKSNQQILTNQSAVRLYYQTFINQENDKFKADGNGEMEYSPITLFGQPPIIPKIEKGPTNQQTENHLLRRKWKKAQKKNEGKIETEKVAVQIETENNFVPKNKSKTKNEFTRKFNCITSELRIKIPMDCHGNEFITRCIKPAHGYCEENAKKAMERFLRRGLFIIEKIKSWESEPQSSHWGRTIKFCHKFVTVPSIPNAVFVEIRGNEGATEEEAEMSCDLIILDELYTFNVIKEAAIELYSQERKGLTDPTRGLDSKLMAWMDSKLATFLKKMDEIEAKTDNFY